MQNVYAWVNNFQRDRAIARIQLARMKTFCSLVDIKLSEFGLEQLGLNQIFGTKVTISLTRGPKLTPSTELVLMRFQSAHTG